MLFYNNKRGMIENECVFGYLYRMDRMAEEIYLAIQKGKRKSKRKGEMQYGNQC